MMSKNGILTCLVLLIRKFMKLCFLLIGFALLVIVKTGRLGPRKHFFVISYIEFYKLSMIKQNYIISII